MPFRFASACATLAGIFPDICASRLIVRSLFRTRRDLAFENLLLRQQLAVLKEKGTRPELDPKISLLIQQMSHTNVTESLTAEWTARQVTEAVGLDKLPT